MTARRNLRTLVPVVGVAVGMAAMAWASVPLYDLFCRVTGYGGRPLVAEAGAGPDIGRVLNETVTVRFDASTAAGMPWSFRPAKTQRTVHLGETALAFYEASNPTARPITGTATFNVTPPIVGGYFVKIDCFCFEEQTLQPGESVEMPVTFYVDPAILDDPQARAVGTITLSYTFFEKPAAAQAAAATTPAASGG